MPSNNRIYVHGMNYHISSRTQEGLPFFLGPLFKLIFMSLLAAASRLYRVNICHFVFMANHFHLIINVDNPEHASLFIKYLKGKSSDALNRFMGRRAYVNWVGRCDVSAILDAEKCVQMINYIYTNPQKAGLVNTIDEYPGLSSWSMFASRNLKVTMRRIALSSLFVLRSSTLSKKEQDKIVKLLKESNADNELVTLELKPYLWASVYPESSHLTHSQIDHLIKDGLRKEEGRLSRERTTPVVGPNKLLNQPLKKDWMPKKFGIKSICLSTSIGKRARFIKWFKEQQQKARDAFHAFSYTDYVMKIPPGCFLPGGRLMANLTPLAIPV